MDDRSLRLDGLDGANPLGFLAALGTVHLAARFAADIRVHWEATGVGWRPVLAGHGLTQSAFVDAIACAMREVDQTPFKLNARLPFSRDVLRAAMVRATPSSQLNRHAIDTLGGLGSDAFADKEGNFHETALRMTRSGDAAGQGLPHYVLASREELTTSAIERALFHPWRYDDDCLSFRWDPVEDQRYALRANDPSNKANKRAGSRGVRAANALAADALALLPVQPMTVSVATTAFTNFGRRTAFTWPIWNALCNLDVLRSVLADPELATAAPDHRRLARRGIVQVFRAERFASSVYYKNFAPAVPV